jgi:hypothetical protein
MPGSFLSSAGAFMSPAVGFDYFGTETHYSSFAGRIISALGGFDIVIVTGEPPASACMLSTALKERAAPRRKVIEISCQRELRREGVLRFSRNLTALLATNSIGGEELGSPLPTSPLIVFDDATELSDEQIQEIFKPICEHRMGAAVLVANSQFLTRLERPILRFWLAKHLLVARFRFQELGADEIPAFIRHQFPAGEKESPFTSEAIAAIASVSGGDPMVVNRFSRRLLELRATSTKNSPVDSTFGGRPVGQMGSSSRERGATTSDEPSLQRIRRILELNAETSAPTRRLNGTLPKLSVATAFCITCIGILSAAWIMVPTGEKLAVPDAPAKHTSATVTRSPSSAGEVAPPSTGVARSAEPTHGSPPQELAGAGADSYPATVTNSRGALEESKTLPLGMPAPEAVSDPSTKEMTEAETAKAVEGTTTSTLPTPAETRPTPTTAVSPRAVPPLLSAAAVAALVSGGDRFLALGDVVSARLYYERAADAGDGQAALRLGMTFDPEFLLFARVSAVYGATDQAAAWYRRANLLGDTQAAILLKRLQLGMSK